MLQANLYDSDFGDSELGWGISSLNPISAIKDAGSYVADKVVDGAKASYSGVKTAGSYVLDKTCASTRDPRIQAGMTAVAAVPSGYTQAAAAGYAATGAACAALYPGSPGSLPPIPGPPLNVQPLQFPMITATKFQRYIAPGNATTPAGTIAAFDPKRGVYRIAVPGLPGFSAPAAFTEVNAQATKPAGAQLVDLKTFETQTGTAKPWYKKPLVLGGIAAGALVVGGGSYMLMRR